MSKAPFPALLDDAERWGCDVARKGATATVYLLGEPAITVRATDTNAHIRRAHQCLAELTGHQINGASGKRSRAHERHRQQLQRLAVDASITDIEQQITAQRERDRLRRAVTHRYFELRDIERLMRA